MFVCVCVLCILMCVCVCVFDKICVFINMCMCMNPWECINVTVYTLCSATVRGLMTSPHAVTDGHSFGE